jgi:hypothetical protein
LALKNDMVVNLSSLDGPEFTELEREIGTHRGLNDVLNWVASKAKSVVHPRLVAKVITQDEFTHDVIIPYKSVFLVYDTT